MHKLIQFTLAGILLGLKCRSVGSLNSIDDRWIDIRCYNGSMWQSKSSSWSSSSCNQDLENRWNRLTGSNSINLKWHHSSMDLVILCLLILGH